MKGEAELLYSFLFFFNQRGSLTEEQETKERARAATPLCHPWLHFKETLESPAIKYLIYLSLNSTDTLCLTHHD